MDEESKDRTRKKANSVLRFSGIGMQMLVTILVFFYIGMKLDERQGEEASTWTLILTLLGVAVALYFMVKDLLKLMR